MLDSCLAAWLPCVVLKSHNRVFAHVLPPILLKSHNLFLPAILLKFHNRVFLIPWSCFAGGFLNPIIVFCWWPLKSNNHVLPAARIDLNKWNTNLRRLLRFYMPSRPQSGLAFSNLDWVAIYHCLIDTVQNNFEKKRFYVWGRWISAWIFRDLTPLNKM